MRNNNTIKEVQRRVAFVGINKALDDYFALYFADLGVWVTGAGDRAAWSKGSEMGINGRPEPLGDDILDLMVCQMHQSSVGHAINNNRALWLKPSTKDLLGVWTVGFIGLLGVQKKYKCLWKDERWQQWKR